MEDLTHNDAPMLVPPPDEQNASWTFSKPHSSEERFRYLHW
jgi:hypothetical protein